MIGPPSQIFLGDYLQALDQLQPDDDATRQVIASLLGLDFLAPPSGKGEEKKDSPAVSKIPSPLPSQKNRDDDEQIPETPKPSMPPNMAGTPLRSRLTPVSTISRSQIAPELLEAARKFPASTAFETTPPPPDPLFHPRWTRGILTAALSTESPDGPIDIERLVENLSQREYLVDLPRLSMPTMRRGLQLLVDMGNGMTPYASDVSSFQKEVRLIVGAGDLEVLRFDGSPLRGAGPGPRKTWQEYQPPPQGRPVLALTDWGINRPGLSDGATEWLDFAQLLRHAESPLVVFTPASVFRWPDHLVKLIHVIHWDRTTTATSVRKAVGRLLAVKK